LDLAFLRRAAAMEITWVSNEPLYIFRCQLPGLGKQTA
jgi:hypothetical protein